MRTLLGDMMRLRAEEEMEPGARLVKSKVNNETSKREWIEDHR
jgi:hypothetical protein